MSIHDDQLRVLDMLYTDTLKNGTLDDIKLVEDMITLYAPPRSSALWARVLENVGNRMTSDDWQTAIGEVCETIAPPLLDPPPAHERKD